MADKKTTKHTITANKRISFDVTQHEDGEPIGTIEVPDGVDPKRVIRGLELGHLILGDKSKPRQGSVAKTDSRAKPIQE